MPKTKTEKLVFDNQCLIKELEQRKAKSKKFMDMTKLVLLMPQIDQKVFDELVMNDGYKIVLSIEYIKHKKHARAGRK